MKCRQYMDDNPGARAECASNLEKGRRCHDCPKVVVTIPREVLMDMVSHLIGAASAYREFARRSSTLTPRAKSDAFFSTRAEDFDKAAERAQAFLRSIE